MMGDSDEDYDGRGARRGRDKFRRERSDFSGDRQGRRDGWGGRRPQTDGGRELGSQSGQWDRRKRDFGDRRGGDRPGHRGDSPPMKRRRRDWDGGGYGGDFGAGPFGGGGGQWGGPEMGMVPDRRPGGVGGGGMPGQGMAAPPMPGAGAGPGAGGDEDSSGYQAPMLSFKQWLAAQTDDVGEEEAVERYNTYKLDYKRTAIDKFYDEHKEEEWFQEKYHPVVKTKRETVVRQQLRTRANAFIGLLQSGRLDKLALDSEHAEAVIKILDSAMIKMEGGDDNDLRILDVVPPSQEQKKRSPERSPDVKKGAKRSDSQSAKKGSTADPPSPSSVPLPSEPPPARKADVDAAAQEAAEKAAKEKQQEELRKKQEAFQRQQKEDLAQMAEQIAAEQAKAKKEKRKHRRRHRDTYSYESDESESDDEDSDDDAAGEPAPPGVEPAPPGMEPAEAGVAEDNEPVAPGVDGVDDVAAPVEPVADIPMDVGEPSAPGTEPEPNAEAALAEDVPEASSTVHAVTSAPAEQSGEEGVCDMEDDDQAAEGQIEDAAAVAENLPEPRALHQTRSLHIRNLPPSVTRAELVEIGKKTPGFLRAAVGEPNPEKRFQRRAWLTYEKNVNISEAHWSINTMKLKDHELNVVTNRDATNRVRQVSHLSLSRHSVAADIELARKIIQHLDEKLRIYYVEPEVEPAPAAEEVGADGDDADAEAVLDTKTPVVKLLTSSNPLLTDAIATCGGEGSTEPGASGASIPPRKASDGEASGSDAEEEVVRDEKDSGRNMFKPDEKQLKVLDRLLLYLRLVHSLDYYQASDLPDEYDMPHRCCVIHVRGPVSATFKASLKDVTDYIKNHEQRMAIFLKTKEEVSADEARQLGLKSIDEAVEKFVEDNCKEVGKDKYMCPLSGKKFRGPEFVRKHIHNKHAGAVQKVRDQIIFFNSFLKDPDRPHMPYATTSTASARPRLHRGPGPMPGPGGPPGMQGGPNPGFDYPPEGMYGPPGGYMGAWGPRPPMGQYPPFGPGMFPFGPRMEMFGRPPFPHGGGGPRGRGRRDRRLMDYRDLDQPEDVDF